MGVNEKSTRETLRRLVVDPKVDARARLAVTLAQTLDNGAGMATAAVARELRATLAELEDRTGTDDGFAELVAGLSAPVGDTAN